MWWDASDLALGTLAALPDKFTHAMHLAVAEGGGGVVTAAALRGHTAVVLGGGTYYITPTIIQEFSGSDATVIVVGGATTASGKFSFIGGQDDDANRFELGTSGKCLDRVARYRAADVRLDQRRRTARSHPHFHQRQHDLEMDGTRILSDVVSSTSTKLRVGTLLRVAPVTAFLYGGIAEIIVINRALTGTEKAQLTAYLTRWAA